MSCRLAPEFKTIANFDDRAVEYDKAGRTRMALQAERGAVTERIARLQQEGSRAKPDTDRDVCAMLGGGTSRTVQSPLDSAAVSVFHASNNAL